MTDKQHAKSKENKVKKEATSETEATPTIVEGVEKLQARYVLTFENYEINFGKSRKSATFVRDALKAQGVDVKLTLSKEL